MKRILGLLGWLGVVLVVAAVALRFIRPEDQEWYQSLAIAGLVVTLLFALSQWRDVLRMFGGRNVKYGSVALGSIVVLLAILVGINWIANREDKRWDLTEAKQFSLSDQTKKVLEELKQPVAITVFYRSDDLQPYRDELSEYANASKNVSVNYVDAVQHPAQANQYQIQQYGTVVFEYAGRTARATTSEEQDLTNALIKVVEGKAKKVYFVQGHGERDTGNADRLGYSEVATALKNDNYDVEKIVLAQTPSVPDDATLVVIAGPKTDYLPAEIAPLDAYLKKGGKLLMELDPPDRSDSPPLTNLIALAKEWGIAVGNDFVVDASGVGRLFGADASVPIVAPPDGYPGHAITDQFNVMTAYRLARSATPIDGGTDGHVAQKVAQTSARSWAETDLKSLETGKVTLDVEKGDKPGPVTLISAVSAPATGAAAADSGTPETTRVVVVGDSDFAGNDMVGFQGNRDLFMNAVNWAAQQENLISIRPKSASNRTLTLTADQGQRLFWLTVFVIPGLLLGTSVWTWWRRR